MRTLRFSDMDAFQSWQAARASGLPKPTPPVPKEQDEQIALIARCRLYTGTYPALRLLMHYPSGGSRHVAEAKKLKAMGVLPGVPDLFLPVAARGYHGWFCEVKSPTGILSVGQRSVILELRARGYYVAVLVGQEAVWENLLWYIGIPK